MTEVQENDLNSILDGLGDELFGTAIDDLPEEAGARLPPPQPGGPYTWILPSIDLSKLWKAENSVQDGKPIQRPRLYFTDYPLTVAAAPPNMDGAGLTVKLTVSTRERRQGKDKVLVSDTMFLSRALGLRPQSIKEMVKALSGASGKLFDADVVWETSCNVKRPIYLDGAIQEGTKGCGQQYAQRPRKYTLKGGPMKGTEVTVLVIPKAGGLWLDSFACEGKRMGATGQPEPCGANLTVFPRLRNFRAPSPEIVKAVQGNGHAG